MNNKSQISLAAQFGYLKNRYPDSSISMNGHNEFIWRYELQPSPLSTKYSIKLSYKTGENPNVYVTSPKPLTLAEGCSKLEHVYNSEKQHLCLYYRKVGEWNSSMIIADIIVPWISEWLFHYEIWVFTGVWHGGGIHIENNKELI